MATAFSRNEQVTASRSEACLAIYLGYPLIRVQVGIDRSESFTIGNCPELDWAQVIQEAADASTTVLCASLQKVNTQLGGRISYARQHAVWSIHTKPMTPARTRGEKI